MLDKVPKSMKVTGDNNVNKKKPKKTERWKTTQYEYKRDS